MTSLIQQTQLTLPEIDLSDDWDDLNFLPQTQPSLPPPPQQQQQPEQPDTDTDTDSITTGLTRALSLPRQINRTSAQQEEDDNVRKEVINISTSNPSHLFWVPASQHPEIAPAEFEKYVDTHGLTIRKKSIKRRQSVLSVYFTANDQQKLMEEIVKNDTERDRRATLDALEDNEDRKQNLTLRRSVSLQLPNAGDYYIRNVPDLLVFDRNSSPLDESRALVPKGDRPLLRRGARTNFKRNSSVTALNRHSLVNRKSESDFVSEQEIIEPQPMVRSASADEGVTLSDHETVPEVEEEPLSPVVEEVRDLCIATRESEAPPRPTLMARSVSTSTATTAISRKSSWSWAFWSDEKSSKKNKNDSVEEQLHIEQQQQQQSEQENRQPQVSKSSDAASISSSATERSKRFTLSSLFSRKSKHSNAVNMDAMISKSNLSNEPPKDFQLNRMNLTRLPLHVERAIYKLSHVKLANPRRPLHEQVLISNQMFWYLSIIATNPPENLQHQPHHQPYHQKKKARKLVKKQRPQAPRKESSSKLNNKIVSGSTFLTNKSARDTSTGFVVPENYLNPKHPKKKPVKTDYDPKQSDSSSDDDDDGDDENNDDDDEEGQQDDVPLALYKSSSRRAK